MTGWLTRKHAHGRRETRQVPATGTHRRDAGGSGSGGDPITASHVPLSQNAFSMKKGSVDNLKVSVRWGCNPKARQMRLTVSSLPTLPKGAPNSYQSVNPFLILDDL